MWIVSDMDTKMAINSGFLTYLETVTLLGGGDLAAETVSELLKVAPNLVCCDGAAGRALALGEREKVVKAA